MPVLIAPALIAVGFSAGVASIIGLVSSVVIGIGFQFVSSLLTSSKPTTPTDTTPQPKPSDGQVTVRESAAPRHRSYGRVKLAGVLMDEGVYNDGGGNIYLTRVFAMGSGQIDSVEEHWLDDGAVALGDVQDIGSGYNVTTAKWILAGNSHVNITFNLGGVAPSYENTNFLPTHLSPEWGADQVGNDIPAAGVALLQTAQEDFVNMFPRGAETLYRQVQRASQVRDITDGVFAAPSWSDNAALVIMDYLTHSDGLRISDSWIANESASWEAAVGICNDLVDDLNGGTVERYKIWNTYYFNERPADVLSRFLRACDAVIYPTPNRGIAIKVGKFEEPTVTIDDDAIIGFSDFGHGIDILSTANTIRARYTNPDADYQEDDATPLANDDDVEARGEIAIDLELFAAPNQSQCQRLMTVALGRANPEWAGKIICNLRALPVLGERFINLTISELGVSGNFEVLGVRMVLSEGSILSALEIDVQSNPYISEVVMDAEVVIVESAYGFAWCRSLSPDIDNGEPYWANSYLGTELNVDIPSSNWDGQWSIEMCDPDLNTYYYDTSLLYAGIGWPDQFSAYEILSGSGFGVNVPIGSAPFSTSTYTPSQGSYSDVHDYYDTLTDDIKPLYGFFTYDGLDQSVHRYGVRMQYGGFSADGMVDEMGHFSYALMKVNELDDAQHWSVLVNMAETTQVEVLQSTTNFQNTHDPAPYVKLRGYVGGTFHIDDITKKWVNVGGTLAWEEEITLTPWTGHASIRDSDLSLGTFTASGFTPA